MTLSLPDRPSLEFLRKQAKDLLRSQRQGQRDVCPVLRGLHRFAKAADAEILSAAVALHEVQFALALEYGLGSWHALKAHVENSNTSKVSQQPKLSQLEIHGHINMEDGFSHVMAAAARLLGVPADYPTVFALSTNAFTPAFDPSEDCAAWWHMYGRNVAADATATALGLEIQLVALPSVDLRYNTPKEQVETLQARQHRLCSPILREAMAGGVVITNGGWEIRGPYGFVPWCWWGVITQTPDDSPALGATLNGRADNPLHHLQDCWVVRKVDEPRLADASVNVLRQAVERIAARNTPFADNKILYGLAAMDCWIEKMRTVAGFCEPCTSKSNRGWACAMTNARAMHHAAGHAAAFLSRELPDWPEESQPHLEHAARRYDRIARLLQPVTEAPEEQGYKAVVGDLDRQKQHAEGVLQPIRAEMAGAAKDIQQALEVIE